MDSFTRHPAPPFRLDLTVWALSGVPVDEMDRGDGHTYRRVLAVQGRRILSSSFGQPNTSWASAGRRIGALRLRRLWTAGRNEMKTQIHAGDRVRIPDGRIGRVGRLICSESNAAYSTCARYRGDDSYVRENWRVIAYNAGKAHISCVVETIGSYSAYLPMSKARNV
jgi:hypothetical protein